MGRKLGYADSSLVDANRRAVDQLVGFRTKWETPATPIVIVGTIGPRGDGYQTGVRMNVEEAYAYHLEQISTLVGSNVDMVGAFTLNYIDEAIGMVQAAKAATVPISVSFTLETNGLLPSSETLKDAIECTRCGNGTLCRVLHAQLCTPVASRRRIAKRR